MKVLRTMIKMEWRLAIRSMDSILFGILFPIGLALILGVIYGDKPAFEGADHTFIQQSFGAVITIGICATGLMGIPLSVADYRHKKILKRYQVTPVSPGMLLFSQVMVQFMIAVISSLGVYLIMKVIFGYRMAGSGLAFLLSYLLVMVTMYGIGMMLASVAPNIKTANLLCTIVYFPMLFLSGATVPYEILPSTMQKVMNILPLTQGIKLLKGFSLGLETEGVWFSVILLVILAGTTIFISIKSFKWE